MTVEQIYEETIRPLPAGDQIRLASRIMREYAGTAWLGYSEEWTDDDLREFAAAGQALIERRQREEGDIGLLDRPRYKGVEIVMPPAFLESLER